MPDNVNLATNVYSQIVGAGVGIHLRHFADRIPTVLKHVNAAKAMIPSMVEYG